MQDDNTAFDEDDYIDEPTGDDESGAGAAGNEPEKQPANDDEETYAGDPDDDDDDPEAAGSAGGDAGDPLSNFFDGLGFDNGLIEFDGEQVRILDLPAEEQRNVITQRLEAEYQRGRDEANPEEGLDANEIALINHVRSHGTVEGYEVTSGLEGLSAEELHRRDIKTIDPDASEEEVEEELVARRGLSNFEKRAGTIRGRFEQQATAARTQAAQQQALEYQQTITQVLTTVKDIEGFPLDGEHGDFARRELTVAGEDGIAPFFRDLADPATQIRLAYLNKMFPAIVKGYEDEVAAAYEKGRNDALGRAPKRPNTPNGAAPAGRARRASNDDDTIGDYGHRR